MHIRILRGANAGKVYGFDVDSIRVGRDAVAELHFDPIHDLDVSARHAVLFRTADGWFVRDMGSTNGTWLNGERVASDTRLTDGDALEFGVKGPRVDVWLTSGPPADSRTEILRTRVRRQSRTLRITFVAAGVAIGLLSLSLLRISRASRNQRIDADRERTALLATIDSQLVASQAALASLRGEMDSLATALRQSEAQVRLSRNALERVPPNDKSADELRRQLRSASEALARQQLAASIDFTTIERANRPAAALVFVEAEDGQVATATAFAVRRDGLLLTVRHVLTGPDNSRRPQRVAIQFSDSEQFFPARIEAIADDADLALLRVENVLGDVPIVARFGEDDARLVAGQPVAVIGFALGGETEFGRVGQAVALPLTTAGVTLSSSEARIELQGWGAAGASGSPVFDADGRVVGVLIGARSGAREQTLIAVPAEAAARLLQRLR